MKYQVVKIEDKKQELAPGGSDLTITEAETLLNELHLAEMCYIGSVVTPIVTLWHSTILGAFAVNVKKRHYEYKIMVDNFADFKILKPQLN